MPRVKFKLEEQFSDMRSNEMAYRFIIENNGTSAIELYSIIPRIPEGVELLEVREPSQIAVKAEHTKICKELTDLLNGYLLTTRKDLKEKYVRVMSDGINEFIGQISGWFGFWKLYFYIFRGTIKEQMKRMAEKSNALLLHIDNLEQASLAFSEFINIDGTPDVVVRTYEIKLMQLDQLEIQMQKYQKASIATIEIGSFFAITYILKFPRRFLTPQKFNFSVEGSYSKVGEIEIYIGSTTASLVISPKPYILTLIAMMSSLLGVILKSAMEGKSDLSYTFFEQSSAVIQSILTKTLNINDGIAAAILAVIFFNIYEFTGLGKKFKMGVGWRSALLIGALCGMMGTRILGALKAFVGT